MLCMTEDDWEFRIRASEASYATAQGNTATSSVQREIQQHPVFTLECPSVHNVKLYQPAIFFPLMYIFLNMLFIF